MSNVLFNNALNRVPQKTPPIWFMRQAGRYHSHYQNLKEDYSFEELCKNPELAAQTALGPINDFDFDVSILFSDILFPLEALGMDLKYNPGPIFGKFINNSNYDELKTAEEAVFDLTFQSEALKITREILPKNKSLIGFVGGPWTVACYMINGKGDLKFKAAIEKIIKEKLPIVEMDFEIYEHKVDLPKSWGDVCLLYTSPSPRDS